jgi:drug/metabolite transporter (DMT)-like permease
MLDRDATRIERRHKGGRVESRKNDRLVLPIPRLQSKTLAFVSVPVLLFSTIFIFSKLIIPPLSPFTYMLLRSGFGTLALLCILGATKSFHVLKTWKSNWRDVFLFSIAFHLLPLIIVFVSTSMTSAMNQVIINNMSLAFVVCLNLLIFKIKPKKLLVIAVTINFFGAFLVIWPPDISQNPSLIGDVIMVVAVLIGSLFPIFNKRLTGKVHPLALSFAINLFPFLAMLPALIVPGQIDTIVQLGTVDFGWLSIMFIGIGVSGVAYLAGNKAYEDKAMTAELYNTFITLTPVLGILWSLLFGETIDPINYIGAALVIVSVFIANRMPVSTETAQKVDSSSHEQRYKENEKNS